MALGTDVGAKQIFKTNYWNNITTNAVARRRPTIAKMLGRTGKTPNIIPSSRGTLAGSKFQFRAKLGSNGSFMGLPADGDVSNIGLRDAADVQIGLEVSIFGGRFIVDAGTLLRSNLGPEGSFAYILNEKQEDILPNIEHGLNVMMFRSGAGDLCTITGAATSATTSGADYITVVPVDECGNINVGNQYDLYNGGSLITNGGALYAAYRSKQSGPGSITFVGTAGALGTVANGYKVFAVNTKGNSRWSGFPEIIDDSNVWPRAEGENQTFDRSSDAYTQLRSQVFTSSPSQVLQPDHLTFMLQKLAYNAPEYMQTDPKTGAVGYLMAIFMNPQHWVAIAQAARARREYTGLTVEDEGLKCWSHDGIPIYMEPTVPTDTLFFPKFDDFFFNLTDRADMPLGADGRPITMSGSTNSEVKILMLGNMGAINFIGSGKMTGFTGTDFLTPAGTTSNT